MNDEKKLHLVVFFLAAAFLAGILPWPADAAAPDADDSVVVPVSQGDCVESFLYHGELEACESVNIHAPDLQDARMVTIKSVLEDGTPVKAGDVVVELEDGDFQRALEAARNDSEVAAAELEKTRFDLKNDAIDLDLNVERRQLELEKAHAMVVEDAVVFSKIDLQKARLGVELAELELKHARESLAGFSQKREASLKVKELQLTQARRKIATQQENIDKSVIRAPAAGIVYKPFIRLNNEMGRVEANKVVRSGDKLLELPSLARFRGVVYVPAADYSFLRIGDPASLSLAVQPDRTFPALVSAKEPYPISRNERLGRNDPEGYLKEYKMTLDLPDTDPVYRPGLTFRAEISATIATSCLYIPRAAMISADADQAQVLALTPSGSDRRSIRTGRKGVAFIEVLEGLSAGDRVILDFPGEPLATDTPDL